MEDANTQTVSTPHDEIVSMMRSRFPDRNFDGPKSQSDQSNPSSPNPTTEAPGPSSQNLEDENFDQGLFEQSVLEALRDGDERMKKLDEENANYKTMMERLNSLFNSSPNAARFFTELSLGNGPAEAIYKAWGGEAFDAFMNGDPSEVIAQIEDEDAQRRADNEAFESEKESNMQATFDVINAIGDELGMDDEQRADLFIKAHSIVANGVMGIYPKELFDMIMRMETYDADLAAARSEGELAGRNAKIQEQLAQRRQEQTTMPPKLSGQGQSIKESRPRVERPDPFMLRVKF